MVSPLLMSPGRSLGSHRNAGDVCLCRAGRGGFSPLNRLITANHERSPAYTAGITHCLLYSFATFRRTLAGCCCCISDPKLTFERPVEDAKVVTQGEKKKKKMAFLCPLTACGSLPTSPSRNIECLWFCGW